jgi:hypothetical protein
MALKRKISGFLILLMLAMQLLLAQHYTVHFSEGQHIGVSQNKADGNSNGNDKDRDGHDKLCQVCLFSKSFSHVLLASPAALLILALLFSGVFLITVPFSLRNNTVVYPARGPPAFLS